MKLFLLLQLVLAVAAATAANPSIRIEVFAPLLATYRLHLKDNKIWWERMAPFKKVLGVTIVDWPITWFNAKVMSFQLASGLSSQSKDITSASVISPPVALQAPFHICFRSIDNRPTVIIQSSIEVVLEFAPGILPASVDISGGPTISVQTKAFIDGQSFLHIKNNELWWQHAQKAKPGKWGTPTDNGDFPTYVNGQQWTPTWPTSGDTRKAEDSLHYSLADLPLFLGNEGYATQCLQINAVHDKLLSFARIQQAPSATNNYEVVVEFNDILSSGAGWFDVEVTLAVPGTCATALPGGCPFPWEPKAEIDIDDTECSGTGCKEACCHYYDQGVCGAKLFGWRHDGDTIGAAVAKPDVDDCCALCAATSGCKFWSFSATKLCTLHRTPNLVVDAAATAVCSYYYQFPDASDPDECGLTLPNWRHEGNLIYPDGHVLQDVASCCEFCQTTAGCKVWTWTAAKKCFLHSAANLLNSGNDGGVCSYDEPIADRHSCGHLFTHGWKHDSEVIASMKAPSIAICCDFCKDTVGCHYFTYKSDQSCLAHSTPNLVQEHGSICSYAFPDVVPNECAPRMDGWGYDGAVIHTIRARVPATCCAFCAAIPECKYWTWKNEHRHCHIHSGGMHVVRNPGGTCGSYTRRQSGIGNHTPRKCEGKWIELDGTCSLPCSWPYHHGKKREIFHTASPAKYGGENCEAESGADRVVPCNRKPCSANCVGRWETETGCSKLCGWGTLTMKYVVLKPVEPTGHTCEHHDGKHLTKPCLLRKCGPEDATSITTPPVETTP